MFRYCSLYSGSSGNCFLIQSDSTNILVDVGVSSKKITSALEELKIDIKKINAILVTHEHVDHSKSLGILSSKYNIPIFINIETLHALGNMSSKIPKNNINIFKMNEYFKVSDFKIFPFPIPHDAANPCGFNIYYNNKKITIATDIGHISDSLIEYLKNSSSILLEANYDPDILKISSYPYLLKKRILGNNGHLSNQSAGKTLSTLYKYGLKNAILIHLSKENNFPELAYRTVYNEVKQCSNFVFDVAPRNYPSKIYEIS